MIKYKMISATSVPDLEKQVNEQISAGRRPKAGMTAGVDGVFYQAMVSEHMKKGNERGDNA